MDLLPLLFNGYFLLLLLRLTIADTGQAAFNRIYRFIVKATDPVVVPLSRLPVRAGRPLSLWICLVLLVLIRGLTLEAPSINFGAAVWSFDRSQLLWRPAASLVRYFNFIFQFYLFTLFIVRFWPPGMPGDETKRLIDFALPPVRLDRAGWGGLFAGYAVLLAAGRVGLASAGLLLPESSPWWGSPLIAVALAARLLPVIRYLIIAAVILSWLRAFSMGGGRFYGLESLAEVFIRPFRPLRLQVGSFDLTPLVAILVIYFVERLVMDLLANLGASISVV